MTTGTNQEQVNTPADSQSTANQGAPSISLDAAAFAAVIEDKGQNKDVAADGGKAPHAADSAIAAVEAGADKGQDKDGGDAEPSFRDLRGKSQDEIAELLSEEGAGKSLEPNKLEAGDANPEGDPDPDDNQKKTPMIPKPRLDAETAKRRSSEEDAAETAKQLKEANDKLAEAERAAAYWKGLADGKGSQPASGKDAAPAKDPLEEINADLKRLGDDKEAAILSIAEQFDLGKITMKEAEQKKATVNKNASTIEGKILKRRDEVLQEQQRKAAPPVENVIEQISSDTRLSQATDKLMRDNPWFNAIPDTAVPILRQQAEAIMEAKGLPNVPTAESSWHLRYYMVEAAKQLGYSKLAVPAGAGNTQAGKGTQPTAEQRKAKLDLANDHPPSLGLGGDKGMNTSADANVNYETVSVKDLAKMMPSDRMRAMLEG